MNLESITGLAKVLSYCIELQDFNRILKEYSGKRVVAADSKIGHLRVPFMDKVAYTLEL